AIQSLGAAVSWQLDAKNVAFKTQLIVNWALLDIAAIMMFYLSFRITNSAVGLTESERQMLELPLTDADADTEKKLVIDD
ncbi:hypothetical protein H4218_002353, partial [Coemansia sp. IMI 209128]